MLVEAHELTRYYGRFRAVDSVSFSIGRGEVVGLLGPNGAGKSTTIRMLAGFLPATEGTAMVAGWDARRHPVELHRHVGYMPENNPLYPEMRVGEYLRFRAELKGVPRKRRSRRIGECMEMCGAADVAGQVIGTLSKGYRQRVGMADALLADPELLVLDEPTIGLDPNQILEVRRLISGLGERHTVLLSTHILAEAEAVCRRVIIIDGGRIVADDTVHALSDRILQTLVHVELRGDADDIAAALAAIEGVDHVHVVERGEWVRLRLATRPQADVREAVYRAAARAGWPLRELTRSRGSLEDVFHRITLGDEGAGPEEAR
jgi:ABC-2 type transport system ATP-binding protein